MASADYTVINTLLIPEHAAWNIRFAGNEMSIVFHEGSRLEKKITAANWPEILMNSRVTFGRSDPNSDPCGYRAVLTLKLAEKQRGRPGLAGALLSKDMKYIRPKETDLLALLEAGELDYIFLYRSVAEQHGLKRLLLPDEVNLRNAELADLYRTVTVEVSGRKPGSSIVKRGAPMVYGVTIPRSSPNPTAALAFVHFLLRADKGLALMTANGQPSVVPTPSRTFDRIPECLRGFACRKK